ncbi:MAG: J domain-containing protein [Myxococcota bacterium]
MDDEDRRRIEEWDETLDYASYYELLGVLEIADEAAIRRAFHEFSSWFHPDAHPSADEATAARLRRVFQRGAEAYRVLVRPDARADYDLSLAKGQMRLGIPSIPPGTVSTVRSLDELCTTASGKMHASRADKLISQGDLAEAKRELLRAWRAEPEPDPELVERLDALDLALFAMGS